MSNASPHSQTSTPVDSGTLAAAPSPPPLGHPDNPSVHDMCPNGKGWTQEVAIWADPDYWQNPQHPAKRYGAAGHDMHDFDPTFEIPQ